MRITCFAMLALWLLDTAPMKAGSMDASYGQAIRAATLYEEYRKNPIAANARYGGKRLSVGGAVGKIGMNEDVGIPYVILAGSELTMGIKCVFPREAMSKLATLKPGSLVSISGVVQGRRHELSDQIILQDCKM